MLVVVNAHGNGIPRRSKSDRFAQRFSLRLPTTHPSDKRTSTVFRFRAQVFTDCARLRRPGGALLTNEFIREIEASG